jgi:hypothetical protein
MSIIVLQQDRGLERAGHEDVVWFCVAHLDFVVRELPEPSKLSTSANPMAGQLRAVQTSLEPLLYSRMVGSVETLEPLVDRCQLLWNAELGLLRVERPVDSTANDDREVDCSRVSVKSRAR